MKSIAWWRQELISWAYPPICASCELPIPNERQLDLPFLCETCEGDCQTIADRIACPICGQAFETSSMLLQPCGNCGDRELAFDFAVSALHSDPNTRRVMHAFKYGKQIHLARLFGCLMKSIWLDARLHTTDSWIVVPVPLHPKRQRERGFNQSLEIAREFIKYSPRAKHLRLAPILKRTRPTPRQAALDRKERLTNLNGAFSPTRSAAKTLKNAPGIFILDDVMTTGTTLSQCAATLRKLPQFTESTESPIVALSALRS